MCLHLSLVLRWRPPLLLRQPANTSLKQTRQMSLNTIGDVSLRSRGHGEVTPSSASRPRHTSDERQGSLFSSSTRTSESPPPPVPHTHTDDVCVWHRNPTVIAYVCTLEHQVCPTMFVLRSTADTSHTWMVTPVWEAWEASVQTDAAFGRSLCPFVDSFTVISQKREKKKVCSVTAQEQVQPVWRLSR